MRLPHGTGTLTGERPHGGGPKREEHSRGQAFTRRLSGAQVRSRPAHAGSNSHPFSDQRYPGPSAGLGLGLGVVNLGSGWVRARFLPWSSRRLAAGSPTRLCVASSRTGTGRQGGPEKELGGLSLWSSPQVPQPQGGGSFLHSDSPVCPPSRCLAQGCRE